MVSTKKIWKYNQQKVKVQVTETKEIKLEIKEKKLEIKEKKLEIKEKNYRKWNEKMAKEGTSGESLKNTLLPCFILFIFSYFLNEQSLI